MGEDSGLPSALELGTRLWLLAGGVAVQVGGLQLSLVPAGVTVLTAAMLWRFGAYAAARVRPDAEVGPFTVGVVLTLAYALPVLAAAVFLGEPWHAPGRWAAVLLVLGLCAWSGAARRVGRPVGSGWPALVRGLPAAVVAAVLVLALAGTAVLTVGLVTGWDRVVDLDQALRAGTPGTALLVLVQVALLPNALLWSGSYALGAGFSLGNGSVVAPAATSLGVLPGLPVLGALPAPGPGSTSQLWWLAAGAVAGAAAAWSAVRRSPVRRFDAAALLGGLAGVAGALVFTGLAWTSGGDLGSSRLTGLGPRLLPLLVMSTTTLGLSGMLTGAVLGVVRLVRRARGGEGGAGERIGEDDAVDAASTPEDEVSDAFEPTERIEGTV